MWLESTQQYTMLLYTPVNTNNKVIYYTGIYS